MILEGKIFLLQKDSCSYLSIFFFIRCQGKDRGKWKKKRKKGLQEEMSRPSHQSVAYELNHMKVGGRCGKDLQPPHRGCIGIRTNVQWFLLSPTMESTKHFHKFPDQKSEGTQKPPEGTQRQKGSNAFFSNNLPYLVSLIRNLYMQAVLS